MLLALTLATYADQDGTRVRPGAERLARVMCVSERTVVRNLATLRSDGLIQRVKQGNRWTHQADEYRLTLPFDLLERDLLDPDESEGLGVTHDT
jgi:DNA-binding MarR family transcriptional regulator